VCGPGGRLVSHRERAKTEIHPGNFAPLRATVILRRDLPLALSPRAPHGRH
jgi:hypothetical protein